MGIRTYRRSIGRGTENGGHTRHFCRRNNGQRRVRHRNTEIRRCVRTIECGHIESYFRDVAGARESGGLQLCGTDKVVRSHTPIESTIRRRVPRQCRGTRGVRITDDECLLSNEIHVGQTQHERECHQPTAVKVFHK